MACFGCLKAGTNRQARPFHKDRTKKGAGKKVKGIKRHLLVDVLGFPLHPVVHDAGIQDRDGARILLNDIKKKHGRLKLFRADGGYRGPIMEALANQEKLKIEIVKRGEEKSVQGAAKTLDCRAIFRMAGACKAAGKTLRKSRQNAGSHDPATLHTNRQSTE